LDSSRKIHARDRHRRNPFFPANETQTFVRCRFDPYMLDIELERLSDVELHRLNMRKKLWRLRNYGRVNIHELSFTEGYQPGRFMQKHAARRASPTGVRIWEKMADICFPQSTQDGIANGVHQDIGIRMPLQSLSVWNFYPSQNEFTAFRKRMNVVANPYVNHWQTIKGGLEGSKGFIVTGKGFIVNRS